MRRRRAGRPHVDWPGVEPGAIVAVCHPDWRGVRVAARSHDVPVLELTDAGVVADEVGAGLADRGARLLVVHSFPPGSDLLIAEAARRGVETRLVLHSSMAQHGPDAGEAEVTSTGIALLRDGALGGLGFVKEGQAEAFQALGVPCAWVPNRVPRLPAIQRVELRGDPAMGVFAHPYWRKNVTTMLGAVAIMGGTAHVMQAPDVAYLEAMEIVPHGEVAWEAFQSIQASVDINLYVTLSECDPLTPLESYLAGVPCLTSRTSATFRSDPELWDLTTVDEIDNPRAIAVAATRLLDGRRRAIELAASWMELRDAEASARWDAFTT